MKALDVAKYLIAKSDEVGDLITNKKLQKILYYVKAWGLVYFNDGILSEPFEAWVHGPVCPEVYQHYKVNGYKPLSVDYNGISSSEYVKKFQKDHSDEARKVQLIDAVFNKYAVLTSFQLEMLSHNERPWIEARGNLSPLENGSQAINADTMKAYYGARVIKKKQSHE